MRRITEFILLLAALNAFPLSTPAAPEPRGLINSSRVPFIANEGQLASPEVKYYAKTFGGTVYALADGKIVYVLPKYESGKKAGAAVITEILRGAFQARPSGAGQSKARVNSFTGGRPENWKTNLPVFDRLDFGEVYDGINLLLSARGNNVEKIFVVSPGADPDEIILGFEGTSGMQIAPDGRLELLTALGKVCFTAPVAWQTDAPAAPAGGLAEEILNASDRTRPDFTPVEVAYALRGDGAVGFRLGSYDRSRPLVIDPFLASTFIGGGGADAVQAIVVDSQTNVYAAGWTDSVDFPVTNNTPFASLTNGDCDVFISKFDASLGVLSVSTYLGGSSNDQAFAVGLDADEQKIWLAGYTESEDFPFAANGYQTNYNGEGDAFAAVLSSSDLELEQATYLGGTNLDSATAIAMDNGSCQQYIVGYTESEDFPVAANGYQTNYNGARDAFAVVFSNTVGAAGFKGGTFLGGTSADQAAAVAASSGDGVTNFIYVAGSTESGDFPVTNGYQKTHAGGADVFVAQLDAWLTNRSAATFLGGTADDEASAVALDVSNRLYVAGYTKSSGFPTSAGAYQSALAGGADAFVSCLTNSVSNLCASTYIGGSGDDAARCLVLDSSASTSLVYLAGYTESDNFPATRSAYNRSRNGAQDAFILRMNGALANLQAATYMGGAANDQALALALSPETNLLFTAGITASEDFPASDVAYETAFRGGASDGFVSRFPATLAYGTLKWRKYLAGVCSSPALTWDGTIAVGGSSSTGLVGFSSAGVERWRVTTTSTVAIEVAPLDGLGAPVIGTNNVIYINTSSGKAYAVQPGGATTLLFERAEVAPSFWTSPALDNHGRCFFSYNEYFYALELSGSLLWTKDLVYSCNALPSVGSNDMVYAAASLGPILKEFVAEDGSISKEWSATSGSIYSSPALDSNGTIYAASGNKLYAFNAGGTVQTWTAGGQIYSSPAIGTNGVIYVGGGNNLYAFNTNGATVKTWHVGKPVNSSPAIAADGSIIVGAANPIPSEAGQVYSFNPDGTTNWVFDTVTDIQFHAPMIDSEGTVYISDRGYLYALYGSAPPAESAWPMFRRDALRTGNQGLNIQNFLRPTGVAASKYGTFSNYVHVSWNGVANAVNYELWRGTNDSPALAGRIYRLTGTNYNDTTIEGGRVYYYWVKARTPVAMSALSDPDSGGIPPFPPENVAATKGIPTNSVVVTWQASSNATLYYVYRSLTNATNTAAQIGTTSATNYNDETLTPGLTNWYWVKAGNDVAGISGFGENDYGGIPCRAPTGLSAGQGAYIRRTDLNWNSSAGASSYLVYRSAENNSSTAVILNETNGLSARDYSGTPLRRYYYWVRTTNEFGLSAFSSPAVGWSLLAAPQKVSASAGAYPNMIRVSWVIGSTDATDHVIFRSLSSDPSTAEWQSDVVYNDPAATNYDDTAITRGPDYYYWVAAKNNYGSSTWTAAGSPGGTIPSTPTDLSASDGAYSNMVKITWNNAAGATSYRVYRDENY
ncbi:MAG: PQQ-binding-like beta-propeller repeat protein, partial [Kiritimatiellae bacterium]|nr:PQQ-binding-like beta-propeller repeat protein [Kiritimatiellia bacterium]